MQDIIDFSVEYASERGLDPDSALSFRILVKMAQQPWHVDDETVVLCGPLGCVAELHQVKEGVRVVMEWLGTRLLARYWDYITVGDGIVTGLLDYVEYSLLSLSVIASFTISVLMDL